MSGLATPFVKRWLWSIALLVPVLFLCERYLDIPLAYGVQSVLYGNARWAKHTLRLPDLLFPIVLLTTCASAMVYCVRRRRGIRDTLNDLLQALAWIAPVSYLAKTALKFLFGRINTRVWLRDPTQYSFHWLHGGGSFDGFPSGHMMVIVALLAACWRYYPRYRAASVALALFLGVTLVATNYHFLSDVIAGWYFAVALEAVLCVVLRAGSAQRQCCEVQQDGAGTR